MGQFPLVKAEISLSAFYFSKNLYYNINNKIERRLNEQSSFKPMTFFESLYQHHPTETIGVIDDPQGMRHDLYYFSSKTIKDKEYSIDRNGIIRKGVFDIAVMRDIKYRHIPQTQLPVVYFSADDINFAFDQYTGELYFNYIPAKQKEVSK